MRRSSLTQFLIERQRSGRINADLRLLIETVARACKKHGKIGKCHPHRPEQIGDYAKMGYRMFMGNSDVSHLRQGVKATVDKLRNGAAAALK